MASISRVASDMNRNLTRFVCYAAGGIGHMPAAAGDLRPAPTVPFLVVEMLEGGERADLRGDDGIPRKAVARSLAAAAQSPARVGVNHARRMSDRDPLGTLCIVLHGHLPYVLHHGTLPARRSLALRGGGGDVSAAARHDRRGRAAQGAAGADDRASRRSCSSSLSHERFKAGFVAYLNERIDRGRQRPARNSSRTTSRTSRTSPSGGSEWYAGRARALRADRPRHPRRVRRSASARGTSRSSPATRRTRTCRCC